VGCRPSQNGAATPIHIPRSGQRRLEFGVEAFAGIQ